MKQNCLLFAYGLLQPEYSPPKTTVDHWPDQIHGDLYDLGDYPGVINIGQSLNLVQGYVLEICTSELAFLDEFEDVDSGEYRRILVKTIGGRSCWVYEYLFELPKAAKPIAAWTK